MPNTYTQLYIQLVFAVKNRESLVRSDIRKSVEKYMTGIVQNKGHKLLSIYRMPDHCHLLVGLEPKFAISDLVRDIKANSSKWINENRMTPYRFSWQEGYGGFSYGKSQVDDVINYILNQPLHHQKRTFKEEYLGFLKKFEVEYDGRYLFDWLE
ncbi:MAG: IS200/IS605 family transposase [Bacteroidota bacterium]